MYIYYQPVSWTCWYSCIDWIIDEINQKILKRLQWFTAFSFEKIRFIHSEIICILSLVVYLSRFILYFILLFICIIVLFICEWWLWICLRRKNTFFFIIVYVYCNYDRYKTLNTLRSDQQSAGSPGRDSIHVGNNVSYHFQFSIYIWNVHFNSDAYSE